MKKNFLLPLLVVLVLVSCNDDPDPGISFEVQPFTLSIDENPDADQLLGTISVSPANSSYLYSLSEEVPSGALKLDPSSGELRVLDDGLFDFEQNPTISAKVTVILDNEVRTSSITINLNNVNESSNFTIWQGPEFTFSKADGTDPSLEANQDRITDDVWITRGLDGGQIYNAVTETSANKASSPAGTKWAIGTVNEIESLNFQAFRDAVGSPKDVVGKDLVLYLEAEDAYLTVKFSSWSVGNVDMGGFAYTRSTQ